MAGVVHSARLAKGVVGPANTLVTIYTCPPGVTTIVKDCRFALLSATATTLSFAVAGPDPGTLNLATIDMTPADDTHSMQPWLVLRPDDRLVMYVPSANNIGYWISGTRLQGVAA